MVEREGVEPPLPDLQSGALPVELPLQFQEILHQKIWVVALSMATNTQQLALLQFIDQRIPGSVGQPA